MQLVSLQMRGGVVINVIFGLKWRHCGPKGGILEYRVILIFWFIILLNHLKI